MSQNTSSAASRTSVRIITGDCRESMAVLDTDSIDSCVTEATAA